MVVLTARLGLRVGDLRRLELGWFDWRAKTLALAQHKTGLPLRLPVPGDVGWAVIDYIRHGRPEAGCAQVFVKHRYPFTAFGSSSSAGCRLGITRGAPGSCSRRAATTACTRCAAPWRSRCSRPTRPRQWSRRSWVTRLPRQPPRTTCGSMPSTCAAAPWTSKMSLPPGKEHVRERADAGRPDRHAGRRPPRRRVPVRLPRTGAAPVRRALPPGRLRRRLDRERSRRGVPLRPPPQSLHHPPRGNRPARAGRTRPPVRLARVGAAGADSREETAPAAAVCVQRRGDPPPVPRHRHPAAVRELEPGTGRPGAVPGVLRRRAAAVRSTRPGTARLRPGPRDHRDTRRQKPREPPRARHRAPGRHRWKATSPPLTPAPNPPTSSSTPATLPGRRTSPRFTTGSGVTSPTPTSPFPGRPAHPFAAARLRRGEPAPLGRRRRGPGGHAALPVGLHGPR